MRNGIIASLECYTHEAATMQAGCVEVRLSYRFNWQLELADDARPLIHSVNGKSAKMGAFSASGIVTGVGDGVASVFCGMPVAIVGPSDAGLEATSVCADISCVTPIPVDLPLSHAALAGFGAYLVNIIKSARMPEGSVCHIIAQNASALSLMLRLCGYPLTADIRSADYVFVDEAEADISSVRKNAVIVLCGSGRFHSTCGAELSCLRVSTPGADWCDARLPAHKVVYPHAYVQNTVADNVAAFLTMISSDAAVLSGFPVATVIGGAEVPAQETADIPTFDGSLLGKRADEFRRRIKPAVVTICTPVGADAAHDREKAIEMVNGWLEQTPTTCAELNTRVVTLSYPDGSVATIQTLPAQAMRHIEIHWEGKSIIIK